MNDPSNGGSEVNPANVRAKMEHWREKARSERKDYEPRIREQVQSQFQEYSPAWYTSIIGHTREKNLLVVQSRLAGFAATLGREFENEEVKALAEHSLETIDTNAMCKWGTIGLAGYMTYRGRHTWQFPFYRPKLGGRFNPNEATSLFSNKKIRGVYPNLIWHTMRFTAYVAVTLILVEPMFRATNHLLTEQRIMKDPRLERFTKDVNKRVEMMMGRPHMTPFASRDQSDEEERHKAEEQDFTDSKQGWQEPEKTSPYRWNQASQPTRPAPQPERNDDWSVLDDDDASPVAASAPSNSASGSSAWDRLRHQSQSSPQQSGVQSSWARVSQPKPQQQSQGGWGEQTSPRESVSYSSSDEGKSGAREQAQAEFDRLLEQERRGVDQERSWGRR